MLCFILPCGSHGKRKSERNNHEYSKTHLSATGHLKSFWSAFHFQSCHNYFIRYPEPHAIKSEYALGSLLPGGCSEICVSWERWELPVFTAQSVLCDIPTPCLTPIKLLAEELSYALKRKACCLWRGTSTVHRRKHLSVKKRWGRRRGEQTQAGWLMRDLVSVRWRCPSYDRSVLAGEDRMFLLTLNKNFKWLLKQILGIRYVPVKQ